MTKSDEFILIVLRSLGLPPVPLDHGLEATEEVDSSNSSATTMTKLDWELPGLPGFFLRSLFSRFDENPNTIPASLLFTSFLLYTSLDDNAGLYIKRGRAFALTLFTAAARNGYVPGQALVPALYNYYGGAYPPDIESSLVEWLVSGVASGSVFARRQLETQDPEALSAARKKFCDQGGYGHLFNHRSPAVSHLHWLASFGSLTELKGFFDMNQDVAIDIRTPDDETSLYLACARGSWEIASELLDHGADPSLSCTDFGITCLHWLFSFELRDLSQAVAKLVDKGANMDAHVSKAVPFLHYPFMLPAGTPLHWAIVLEVDGAVKTLLEHGADPFARNGSDPYKYDGDVRVATNFGSMNNESYSVPPAKTKGLSALDMAAANHYAYPFEALGHRRRCGGVHGVDEEGFTIAHRLSTSCIQRTRSEVRFSSEPFLGGREGRDLRMRRTVSAIKSLGCDLNQLSTPQTIEYGGRVTRIPFQSHTPLMLAAKRGCRGLVGQLIDAGAAVNIENDGGETALHYFPHVSRRSSTCSLDNARKLMSSGADVMHRAKNGNSALCVAAQLRRADLMELFFSSGAEVTERDNDPNSLTSGTSVFALFSKEAEPFDEKGDQELARLLQTFLLNDPVADTIKEVIDKPSRDGETVLHRFARQGLGFIIRMLIESGADANAPSTYWTVNWEEGTKSSWQETPLTAAVRYKAMIVQYMEDDRYSIAEFENLCTRADGMIRSLREQGGVEIPKIVTRRHVPEEVLNASGLNALSAIEMF